MAKRVLSTLLLWAIVLAVPWFLRTGGAVALVGILSALTLREFYRLQAAAGRAPFAKLGMFFGTLITVSPWVEARFGPPGHALLPLAVLVFSVRILGERDPDKRWGALASTIFGLVYVAVLLQYLVRIVTPRPGDAISVDGRLLLCLWLVVVVKLCDTGALLTGMAVGRHKMAPGISPKKTWEGAAGGLVVAVAAGAGAARLCEGWLPADFTPLRAAILAAAIGAVAIVSDLVESILKRDAGIKDSGSAIPGIGGVFDVSDSLLLAAPVGYFLFGLR
jgi:phosphatidate cytidylyltransferase